MWQVIPILLISAVSVAYVWFFKEVLPYPFKDYDSDANRQWIERRAAEANRSNAYSPPHVPGWDYHKQRIVHNMSEK